MKQEAIFKRFTRRRFYCCVGNQQGQAVVEYVLLMIVVLSLVLGLRGVFSSFNNFMSDFMGEYIVCLMEYGELPALGVQNAELKKHTDGTGRKCEFRKFAATTNFPGGGSGGTSGSTSTSGSTKNGSNGSTGSNSNSSSSANKNGNNKGAGSSSGSRSSGSDSSGGSSGRSSAYSRGQISRPNSYATADAPQPSTGAKIKVIEDDGAGSGRNRTAQDTGQSSQRRGAYQNGKYKAITGGQAEEIDRQSKSRSRKPSSSVLATSEEGYRFVPHKRTFTPPPPAGITEPPKDEDFSLGNFMKWIIIAGIVIACFILFGGQIMNYSNSDN